MLNSKGQFSRAAATCNKFKMRSQFFPLTLVLSFLLVLCSGQELRSIVCNATLPFARHSFPAVYDGENSIFLFGGNYQTAWNTIMKYDILNDRIEQVGSLPSADFGQSCILIDEGNIICLGGYNDGQGNANILRFDPSTNNITTISSWPRPPYHAGPVSVGNGKILSFGDWFDRNRRAIFEFDTQNFTSNITNNVFDQDIRLSTAAVLRDEVHLLYGTSDVGYAVVNPETFSYQTINTNFGATSSPAGAFSDGTNVFALAAINSTEMDRHPAILKIKPEDGTFTWHQIFNHGECYLNQCGLTGVAFVPSYQRMYIFGGILPNFGGYSDEIRYIDLSSILENA